jgi:hypothetical protein
MAHVVSSLCDAGIGFANVTVTGGVEPYRIKGRITRLTD